MCENVKLSCSCDIGYDKGVLKKTIENSIFTIFGNVYQENSIVIRYHGYLTDNENAQNFNLSYCFDNQASDKKTISLTKCTKCDGECFCSVIDLDKHTKLYFSFEDDKKNIDKNGDKMFELNIIKDPISSIMQRYGFEKNENLPVKKQIEDKKINCLQNLLDNIKYFLCNLIVKTPKTN